MRKIRFVDIGDSWNAGFRDDTRTDGLGWIGHLDPERFEAVARLSVSGSTAAQWAADFDGRLTRAVEAARDADVCFCSLGGNDAFAAQADGKVTFAEITAGVFNLRSVVAAIRGTGCRVLVMLYAPPYAGDAHMRLACAALNAMIVAATAGQVNAGDYICAENAFYLKQGMMVGIHPSEDGYECLARYVERSFF